MVSETYFEGENPNIDFQQEVMIPCSQKDPHINIDGVTEDSCEMFRVKKEIFLSHAQLFSHPSENVLQQK